MKPIICLISSPTISPNESAVLYNLGRMVKDEFDLHLLCGYDANCKEIKDLYTIHYGANFNYDIADLRYSIAICNRHIKKRNFDLLINVCSPATVGFACTLFSKKQNTLCLIRMTGNSFEESKLFFSPWKSLKSRILHGFMATTAYRRADHILAIGEILKSELIRRHFNPDKVSVLPQPFDRGLFIPVNEKEKKQIKKELGLCTDRQMVLYVGRLSWLKGTDRICKTVEIISKQSQKFQFCLVGKGEYEDTLKNYPTNTVFLPGLVPHNEVYKYFQAADLLIFPSRTEGLPNTILEALSCNIPVIASPVGDIPNWVSNIATEPDEYVEYILKGNYQKDKLPDILEFEQLKKAYINLFNMLIKNKK